ncbi:MAG TPA: hypothetical protein PL131_01790 [Methylotenera sp.]|nr:hypothetical protein [Methylotenera sp.]HPH04578.1 hypothetical protein [Methylotenera sp.]HPN00747.1 hypothetical protein [Methylotenera sp.]
MLKTLLTLSLLFSALLHAPASLADETRSIAVVIASNAEITSAKSMLAEDLSLIYWRKKQYWQGGLRIHPVNLHAEHPLRLIFSKTVLGNLPAEQTNYWNGLYFHGTSPPYSVQSEEAVLRYVASTQGAIGYVDACKVDARVKAILWLDDNTLSTQKPAIKCAE